MSDILKRFRQKFEAQTPAAPAPKQLDPMDLIPQLTKLAEEMKAQELVTAEQNAKDTAFELDNQSEMSYYPGRLHSGDKSDPFLTANDVRDGEELSRFRAAEAMQKLSQLRNKK